MLVGALLERAFVVGLLSVLPASKQGLSGTFLFRGMLAIVSSFASRLHIRGPGNPGVNDLRVWSRRLVVRHRLRAQRLYIATLADFVHILTIQWADIQGEQHP